MSCQYNTREKNKEKLVRDSSLLHRGHCLTTIKKKKKKTNIS